MPYVKTVSYIVSKRYIDWVVDRNINKKGLQVIEIDWIIQTIQKGVDQEKVRHREIRDRINGLREDQ